MNAILDQRMSKAEFLRWVQGREGRYELSEGRIVQQMTGGTFRHFNLADAIGDAIKARMDRRVWWCTTGGPGVDVPVEVAGVTVRYPDVVVGRHGVAPTALTIDNPVVIFEVLSPSSVTLDLVIKPREYLSIVALEAYIAASQEEPRLTVWQRGADGIFPSLPVELTDPGDKLQFGALSLSITVGELYSGFASV